MNNGNQLKIGSLLSYAQMILGVVISLVYTPLMLKLLGQSEYGLYNTVASTISMLSLLSLGFNSGYIRYYSKYKQNNDTQSIWKLNGLFLIIFSIIGLVALACGFFLSFNLDLVFSDGLTASEYSIARVLMILLTFNLAISFPMSVFSHIISAHEKFVVLKVVGIIKTVVSPLVTLPLLLLGFRSIAMVAVTLALAILLGAGLLADRADSRVQIGYLDSLDDLGTSKIKGSIEYWYEQCRQEPGVIHAYPLEDDYVGPRDDGYLVYYRHGVDNYSYFELEVRAKGYGRGSRHA